eukprot:1157706-Pelagomonas_calceolata.AAC.10
MRANGSLPLSEQAVRLRVSGKTGSERSSLLSADVNSLAVIGRVQMLLLSQHVYVLVTGCGAFPFGAVSSHKQIASRCPHFARSACAIWFNKDPFELLQQNPNLLNDIEEATLEADPTYGEGRPWVPKWAPFHQCQGRQLETTNGGGVGKWQPGFQPEALMKCPGLDRTLGRLAHAE